MMIDVAIQPNLMAVQVDERGVLPVVGVSVRQDHGLDGGPRRVGGRQPRSELSRSQTDVNQNPEAVGLHQASVAAAAAGEHGKTQTDPSRASIGPTLVM